MCSSTSGVLFFIASKNIWGKFGQFHTISPPPTISQTFFFVKEGWQSDPYCYKDHLGRDMLHCTVRISSIIQEVDILDKGSSSWDLTYMTLTVQLVFWTRVFQIFPGWDAHMHFQFKVLRTALPVFERRDCNKYAVARKSNGHQSSRSQVTCCNFLHSCQVMKLHAVHSSVHTPHLHSAPSWMPVVWLTSASQAC